MSFQAMNMLGLNSSMPATMARERAEVRWRVGTGTAHHLMGPLPKEPEVFGWKTWRTCRRKEVTCLGVFSITASGPKVKVGKEPAVGGAGGRGTRPGKSKSLGGR